MTAANTTSVQTNSLTEEQLKQYEMQGFLLVSGLIPEATAREAEEAMWRHLGVPRNGPYDWSAVSTGHHSFDDATIAACYTPAMIAAAARLAGDDPATFRAPSRPYAINVLPQPGPWHWPGPHIDHAIKEHGHRTFPRAFRIAAMTFLSDVPSHGGGTVVWPGSHQKLLSRAQSDPARFELMWTLNQELKQIDLGEPLETTPRCGDVLFYHYLCAHAGSMNTSDRPRLALNMKW